MIKDDELIEVEYGKYMKLVSAAIDSQQYIRDKARWKADLDIARLHCKLFMGAWVVTVLVYLWEVT